MKKNLTKKLVLKKHTMSSLNAGQLEALQGGATMQWKCYYSDGETLCGSCEFCGGTPHTYDVSNCGCTNVNIGCAGETVLGGC